MNVTIYDTCHMWGEGGESDHIVPDILVLVLYLPYVDCGQRVVKVTILSLISLF